MEINELNEINEAIDVLKQLGLPISIEQLQERKKFEVKYLSENLIPQFQAYIERFVEEMHIPFCLLVEHEYGSPVQIKAIEKKTIIENNKKRSPSIKFSNAFDIDEANAIWNKFFKSVPAKNSFAKFTLSQSYSTLSKLLHVTQTKEMMRYTSLLFKELELPTNGMLSPRKLIDSLHPKQLDFVSKEDRDNKRIGLWSRKQKVETLNDGTRKKLFDNDGVTPITVDKFKFIKEGQWSLKIICELIVQKRYFEKRNY